AASGAFLGDGRRPDRRDASLFFPAIRRKTGKSARGSRGSWRKKPANLDDCARILDHLMNNGGENNREDSLPVPRRNRERESRNREAEKRACAACRRRRRGFSAALQEKPLRKSNFFNQKLNGGFFESHPGTMRSDRTSTVVARIDPGSEPTSKRLA